MKRPWQIWIVYGLCLAIVVPAMAWLSVKVLEMDRLGAGFREAAEEARAEAELQELVSAALWRLDWTLTPLVAQEAARPYFVYEPFFELRLGEGKTQLMKQVASPLLVQPSEYVLLHFQLTPDDGWTSPQRPLGAACEAALTGKTTRDNVDRSADLLSQLQASVSHSKLLGMLPEQLIPPFDDEAVRLNGPLVLNNYGRDPLNLADQQVTNDLGLSQIPQQLLEFRQTQRPTPPINGPGIPQGYQSDRDQQADVPQDVAQVGPQQTNLPQQGAEPRQSAPQQSAAQQVKAMQANAPEQQFEQQMAAARVPPAQNQILRGGGEWFSRNRRYQAYANSVARQQRQYNFANPPVSLVREGVSRPVWVDGKLLLARRVLRDDRVFVQGCWLDWNRIKEVLLVETEELLPGADLIPATPTGELAANRTLATLPVQLVAAPVTTSRRLPNSLSALRLSLIIAWSSLFIATVAVTLFLHGVVKLSERRGAFVSAVTHELRTPLTTFRMYAEMLAEGMVPQAEQRRRYLETLRVEADRLSHLVENVLQYARLERGRPGRQRQGITVEQLLERCQSRLEDRAGQAEMKLQVEAEDDTLRQWLVTDPVACEQILFNLVDNACKYAVPAQDRRIHLTARQCDRALRIGVRDHGPGIPPAGKRRLFLPFSKTAHEAAHSAPGVGLGLALCQRLARQLGGSLSLDPAVTDGAAFVLQLPVSKPPAGAPAQNRSSVEPPYDA